MTTRTFDDQPAEQGRMPLFIGLVGPSGSGKTFSALRLATGFQRLSGGKIYVIDSEARRALAYAPKKGEAPSLARGTFEFRHLPFGAPFGPLDYLAAIEHCVKQGAKNIVVDSGSHEHEGPGGVLEMHAAEVKRLMAAWRSTEDKVKLTAWGKPKSERRRLINTLMQMDCNFIFCFRAKQKLKIVKGKDPEILGYMPIAGDDWIYEMTAKFLMYPGANGMPTLQSDFEGEKAMIKLPNQFRPMFPEMKPRQLTEDLGVEMATWAAGSAAPDVPTVNELLRRYDACSEAATYKVLEDLRRLIWSKATAEQKVALKGSADGSLERIEASAKHTDPMDPDPTASATNVGDSSAASAG